MLILLILVKRTAFLFFGHLLNLSFDSFLGFSLFFSGHSVPLLLHGFHVLLVRLVFTLQHLVNALLHVQDKLLVAIFLATFLTFTFTFTVLSLLGFLHLLHGTFEVLIEIITSLIKLLLLILVEFSTLLFFGHLLEFTFDSFLGFSLFFLGHSVPLLLHGFHVLLVRLVFTFHHLVHALLHVQDKLLVAIFLATFYLFLFPSLY